MKEITKEYYKERVGEYPEQDYLERCNCSKAGKQLGHHYCGWYNKCNLPRFICGHLVEGGNN